MLKTRLGADKNVLLGGGTPRRIPHPPGKRPRIDESGNAIENVSVGIQEQDCRKSFDFVLGSGPLIAIHIHCYRHKLPGLG